MEASMSAQADLADLKVIAFDVFGTVVDWHGGIAAEVERALPGIDGSAFALAWRAGYKPAMQGVM
jgi:2-haloacid dehalogenase